ncbi:MAG TPA: PQQ-binding-like beta-propeller repeat protein [Alphaproteobacteria bacterium]|nr:PQQ-binding-like beta-propeller repeat protein [Alphaproteobacteria bacterium]
MVLSSLRKAGFCLISLTILSLPAGHGARAQGFSMPAKPDPYTDEYTAREMAPLKRLTPVTQEMLRNPPVQDWINWRRTQNGWGYSPLKAINRDTVKNLRFAWAWTMLSGPTTSAPIVHDGVIFVHNFGDTVQALNAANGDLLWSYKYRLPRHVVARARRALAIYGDNIYVATSDLHLIALNMKTGKLVFDQEVADWKKRYYFTTGPIIAHGKVILGMSGCGAGQPGGCFITGHDPKTGKEIWRFNTVARPGEPGGNTWNDLPLEGRFGGSVWTPGTYDPDLNLVYFGVAQPYPWSAKLRGTETRVNKPGVTNNLLYTNSTVALNPDTGKLVWYHQHLANDSWDQDYAFERQIVELPVNGKMRKLVVTSGKMAIIEALDAKTGKFIFAKDMGVQDIVTAIDPKTGKKTVDRSRDPDPGKSAVVCPHPGGARSWPGVGYNPETRMMYMPLQVHCGQDTPYPKDPGQKFVKGAGSAWVILPPKNSDGHIGRLDALNLASRKLVWEHRDRPPQSSASLPTGGGIVFQGDYDRYFRAYDDRDGKILWQVRLNDIPNSYPITYEVDGKQYVAVQTGSGTPYTGTFHGLVPDIHSPPQSGAQLWVFKLNN